MTEAEAEVVPPTRRIRPWIAALLTFLGWGLGFYYARRTRAAVWWAVISVVAGLLLGVGVVAYAVYTRSTPLALFNSNGWSPLDSIHLDLSAILAVWVWFVASQRQSVARGSPVRLFGYIAVWLLPIIGAVVMAMAIRFTLVQPFRNPSGSMQPTLHVGDYFAATKWSYGYSRFSFAPLEGMLPGGRAFGRQPKRGDVVVFRASPEPNRDFVKRLVGLPGDRIQMIGGVLHINGRAVEHRSLGIVDFENEDGGADRIQAYRETLPNGVSYTTFDRGATELDDTPEYIVPEGHYFMLGDDRDNSADSRVLSVIGYVPYDNLVGRVDYVMGAANSHR